MCGAASGVQQLSLFHPHHDNFGGWTHILKKNRLLSAARLFWLVATAITFAVAAQASIESAKFVPRSGISAASADKLGLPRIPVVCGAKHFYFSLKLRTS
ncbi:hypothetical protein GCM10010946_08020 [Undibacterium squillarum]|uniref:Uncharacterized protein n=1 Tax=Undibacterium squillarum TaxID=1131567 RepID=A0ABQ2XVJ1_9BURK|nr:hypothetical protein GCM10010946_08020 [Undibacterium squillarum]